MYCRIDIGIDIGTSEYQSRCLEPFIIICIVHKHNISWFAGWRRPRRTFLFFYEIWDERLVPSSVYPSAASVWFFGHLLFCIMPSILLLLLWCVFPRSAIFLYSFSREYYYYCLILHYTRWGNPQYSAYLYIVYYTIHTHMYIITCYVAIVSFRYYIHVNVCVVLLHRILLYCTCV